MLCGVCGGDDIFHFEELFHSERLGSARFQMDALGSLESWLERAACQISRSSTHPHMDGLVRALDVLSAMVRSCYGPCAEEALLFSPPDPPVVTADGHALLVAWRRGLRENRSSHGGGSSSDCHHEPMQTLILDAAESLYLQIGDGASEFVLLLHGAVTHAVDAIRLGQSQWGCSEVSFRQLATAFGALRRECEQMLNDYAEWQLDLCVTTAISFTTAVDGKLRPSREVCYCLDSHLMTHDGLAC